MVTLTGISKEYHSSHRVLKSVDLQVRQGGFLYIVGGSGAGKSTLLRLIATEESPSSGTVSLFGYNLARVNPSTLKAIRQVIGYIPQDLKLIPDLSVMDNVVFGLSASGQRRMNPQTRRKISELLATLGLEKKHSVTCRTLSGGEAQRVAFARALIRSPELIIADEPTGSQDRDFTWEMMDQFIKAHLKGCTVILATHDREIVRRVRRPCALLRDGRISVGENLCFF